MSAIFGAARPTWNEFEERTKARGVAIHLRFVGERVARHQVASRWTTGCVGADQARHSGSVLWTGEAATGGEWQQHGEDTSRQNSDAEHQVTTKLGRNNSARNLPNNVPTTTATSKPLMQFLFY